MPVCRERFPGRTDLGGRSLDELLPLWRGQQRREITVSFTPVGIRDKGPFASSGIMERLARHTICMVELPGNAVPWGGECMRLRVGELAPLFDVVDLYGRRFSLSASYGHPVLLTFYRSAVCPLCNIRLAYLLRRARAYQNAGLSIVAFFESSPAPHMSI